MSLVFYAVPLLHYSTQEMNYGLAEIACLSLTDTRKLLPLDYLRVSVGAFRPLWPKGPPARLVHANSQPCRIMCLGHIKGCPVTSRPGAAYIVYYIAYL
jgi:hypothetical protein